MNAAPLFTYGRLLRASHRVFLIYSERCCEKMPGKYKYTDRDAFFSALDGYARLTKKPRDLSLLRRFVRNVLNLDTEDFDCLFGFKSERRRDGKRFSYDACVDEGKKVRDYFESFMID